MQITATSAVQAVRPAGPRAGEAPPAEGAAAPTKPSTPVRLLNPQPVIDQALGIVVTEYFSRAGDLTNQYPTERALENYRIHGLNQNLDGAT